MSLRLFRSPLVLCLFFSVTAFILSIAIDLSSNSSFKDKYLRSSRLIQSDQYAKKFLTSDKTDTLLILGGSSVSSSLSGRHIDSVGKSWRKDFTASFFSTDLYSISNNTQFVKSFLKGKTKFLIVHHRLLLPDDSTTGLLDASVLSIQDILASKTLKSFLRNLSSYYLMSTYNVIHSIFKHTETEDIPEQEEKFFGFNYPTFHIGQKLLHLSKDINIINGDPSEPSHLDKPMKDFLNSCKDANIIPILLISTQLHDSGRVRDIKNAWKNSTDLPIIYIQKSDLELASNKNILDLYEDAIHFNDFGGITYTSIFLQNIFLILDSLENQ